jgi:YD repeat-containing protein
MAYNTDLRYCSTVGDLYQTWRAVQDKKLLHPETYDVLNRLVSRVPDQSLVNVPESFTYSATGQRASMTDASGTTTFTYDNLDRLKTKATPQGTLSYTYDGAGDIVSVSSSNTNGVSLAYTYDNLSRLSAVVDLRLPSGQNTTSYTYDAVSNQATVTYPNGLQSSFAYDNLNRLKTLNGAKAGYSYNLGASGNKLGATESGGRTLTWAYDGIYRLTNETIALDPHSKNGAVAYGLDPFGNRISQGYLHCTNISMRAQTPSTISILLGELLLNPPQPA